MSGGERPIGTAKGKQSDTEALCQTPPPPPGPAWVLSSAVALGSPPLCCGGTTPLPSDRAAFPGPRAGPVVSANSAGRPGSPTGHGRPVLLHGTRAVLSRHPPVMPLYRGTTGSLGPPNTHSMLVGTETTRNRSQSTHPKQRPQTSDLQ